MPVATIFRGNNKDAWAHQFFWHQPSGPAHLKNGMEFFGNTQHGNTTKEMKGIGAFAHTGVPTCIHPRNGVQVQAWQLSGDEGKFGWSQPKPLVLLSETFGCWWARMIRTFQAYLAKCQLSFARGGCGSESKTEHAVKFTVASFLVL